MDECSFEVYGCYCRNRMSEEKGSSPRLDHSSVGILTYDSFDVGAAGIVTRIHFTSLATHPNSDMEALIECMYDFDLTF